jgi:Lrp/AsnC family leucine-responsive transcriptional regulator
VDALDKAIVMALQDNGRMTIQELSDRVGLSPTPCHRRVRALERDGVITGYTAVLDPRKCGLNISLYVFIKLINRTRENIVAFEDAIQAMDEVVSCQLITGPHDYMLAMHVPDIADYEFILKERLAETPSIAEIQTSIVLSRVKDRKGFALP